MGEEADALNDWLEDGDYYHSLTEEIQTSTTRVQTKAVEKMKRRYEVAKRSKAGSTIACATCGKQIVKKSYQTKFCCNRGRKNCKDRYWNLVKWT
jgi:hypothetical protein